MVESVRRGHSRREVSREYGVSLSVIQYWLRRAGDRRLDRVDWEDRPGGPDVQPRRTPPEMEKRILFLRQTLKDESDLGEYGAVAIKRGLEAAAESAPSVRTIGRVLARNGALDGRIRQRHPAPPKGWYLPRPTGAEVDLFDTIEDLRFVGGQSVEVLTGISLRGGLPAAWPQDRVTAKQTVAALIEHWSHNGLPDFAQFDNATIFQGAHHYPDTMGRVTRLCLSLNVTPVFAPVREPAFQAAIENFNGRWQKKVWTRFTFPGFPELKDQSDRFVAACRLRGAPRIDNAPNRRTIPRQWKLDLQARPSGTIIYLRRTDPQGAISLLGHQFEIAPHWHHRLVRAEVCLNDKTIRFFALRRKQPADQPLLKECNYQWPQKRFQE